MVMISDDRQRLGALAELVPLLPNAERETALRGALADARAISDWHCAGALAAAIAGWLSRKS